MAPPTSVQPLLTLGRYAVFDVIATGGMASVHFGRLRGAAGFGRTVAIKRMHPHLAAEPALVTMFIDEARLAARISHPNVVSTLDVVAEGGEYYLVLEYVEGASLSRLVRAEGAPKAEAVPPSIASAIVLGVLRGLHAAHLAKGERGEPLELIHRDISPQNILVGTDGVARILDFGVAKAVPRLQKTLDGSIKGKLAYMAPEQLRGKPLTQRVDTYAASVVLWEALCGRGLFSGQNEGEVVEQVRIGAMTPPGCFAAGLPADVDTVTMRGLSLDPAQRFASAAEMAAALEAALPPANPEDVSRWVKNRGQFEIARRHKRLTEIEQSGWGESSSARRGPWRVVWAAAGALLLGAVTWAGWHFRTARADPPLATPTTAPAPAPTPAPNQAGPAPGGEKPPARPALARRACNPPYTRGTDGRIHWKLECL
jgi:serine/threonine protein kinase